MQNEQTLLKWLNGELSEEEVKDLKKSEDFETLENIAFYTSQMQAPEVDAQEALAAFKDRRLSKKEIKVVALNYKMVLRIAAVLVIMLASSYVLFFNNIKSFETHLAQTQTIILPDASEVILNAESTLNYNKKTWSKKRILDLAGEAFFKVASGQKFTVNTSAGIVQVLGTQFNVKQRVHYFEVHCYEGLVAVTYNNQTLKLSKGETFRVMNGTIQVIAALNENTDHPSWLEAESSFTKIPLIQVIRELERHYDLKVVLDNVDDSQLFTGTFTHENRAIALQSITIPLKLSYKIEGKTVTLQPYEK